MCSVGKLQRAGYVARTVGRSWPGVSTSNPNSALELAPYPVDAPGGPRKAFLEAVNQTLLGISSRRIKGLFLWEPASDCGRDYFDDECNALPVITVFDRFKRD